MLSALGPGDKGAMAMTRRRSDATTGPLVRVAEGRYVLAIRVGHASLGLSVEREEAGGGRAEEEGRGHG